MLPGGHPNHSSHHTGGQKYRQGDHREHREHHEQSNKNNNEHDRVVFLKEEESFSGNHLQGASQQGSHQGNLQANGDMNELVLLDWNTPRNLNKGKSETFCPSQVAFDSCSCLLDLRHLKNVGLYNEVHIMF